MEQNMDAESVYFDFSKRLSKCRGNIDEVIGIIKEYNGKVLIMNCAPISFRFASCVSKLHMYELMNPEEYNAIVRAHGDIVIKYGDSECNYWFVSFVKGSDIDKHKEAILKCNGQHDFDKKIDAKIKKLR